MSYLANIYSEDISCKAGGEGLDLKRVRYVVVMDPPWNDAGLQQITGRAIRYKSHVGLPAAEQKVVILKMVLTFPEVKKWDTGLRKIQVEVDEDGDDLVVQKRQKDSQICRTHTEVTGDQILYDQVQERTWYWYYRVTRKVFY